MCDIAGPGFDMYKTNGEPRMAAIHSQCFHTDAKNKGTTEQTCHQDWYFGDCGVTQIAAGYVLFYDFTEQTKQFNNLISLFRLDQNHLEATDCVQCFTIWPLSTNLWP